MVAVILVVPLQDEEGPVVDEGDPQGVQLLVEEHYPQEELVDRYHLASP